MKINVFVVRGSLLIVVIITVNSSHLFSIIHCERHNLRMYISSPISKVLCFILIFNVYSINSNDLKVCEKSDEFAESDGKCNVQGHFSRKRYILYDVNPPEGFNLRRDVYIRVAVFIKSLAEKDNEFQWYLVLPAWGNLYHWRSMDIRLQKQLPWGTFFDIPSLQSYAPVIETYQFLKEYPSEGKRTPLDIVYVLQNDEEMFKTGKFQDKNQIVNCSPESVRYRKLGEHKYTGYFWEYSNITSKDVRCIVFHGTMRDLKQNLKPTLYRSVMFDHMEIPLHDFYGSQDYWKARRSMRYNSELYKIANEYREKYLNSTDAKDNTEKPADWTKEKARRNAIGGPYLSVHLRRRDFLVGRSKTVPTIKSSASQLKDKLDELKLRVLFVATDAEQLEFDELKSYLSEYTVLKYTPSDYVINKFKDGGVAIIDQIICSYARYFIGTHESTFTFRIQEDREIIGFPTETTFNRLCKAKEKCPSSGQWEIVW